MELIKIEKIGGIKCDNPKCDYKDSTVRPQDYLSWLNKPCPKCGSNLLTKEDLLTFINLLKFVSFINKMGNKLPKFVKDYIEKKANKSEDELISVHGDGSGKLIFEKKKK